MRIKHYIALGVLAALLAAFGIVADQVTEGETLKFDNAVLMALRVPGDRASPIGPSWLPEAARDVTALGSFSVLMIPGRTRSGDSGCGWVFSGFRTAGKASQAPLPAPRPISPHPSQSRSRQPVRLDQGIRIFIAMGLIPFRNQHQLATKYHRE